MNINNEIKRMDMEIAIAVAEGRDCAVWHSRKVQLLEQWYDSERQEQLAKEEEYETKEALGMNDIADKKEPTFFDPEAESIICDLEQQVAELVTKIEFKNRTITALRKELVDQEKREFIKQYVLKNLPFEKMAEFRGQEDFEGYIEICGRLWDLICKECEL